MNKRYEVTGKAIWRRGVKYRKKPVVVEAIQYFDRPEYMKLVADFVDDSAVPDPITGDLMITTLEGIMRCCDGDWIIKGVNGEFYPCKPDIFDKTYELVGD